MVAWLYLPNHGNQIQGLDPSEMNIVLADLLQKKNKSIQPSIPKIYFDVLQALKSNVQSRNEHAAGSGFVETLTHNLVELPTVSNPCQIVGLSDQTTVLQEMRNLLRDYLIHLPVLDLEFPCQDMDTIIVDAGLLVYSLYYIKILGLGYVNFLLNNLKEFLVRYSDSLAPIVNQLQIIQNELGSTQPFLEEVMKEWHNKHERLQQWATQLIGKAYEEITLTRAEVQIQERRMLNLVPQDTMHSATAEISSQLAKTTRMNEEIISFEDVMKELRNKLLKGCRELDVISIVGMPGLVISHFDIRAQCCVSQMYIRMDLLLTILHDAIGVRGNFSSEADAADKLRRTLLAKRYLILVDDVSEASAWDDLRSCFHDANNGSRIILTT
ncbi:hypothetical protein FXO38_03235 [Capsicum annuum]|nr:hypothetical protein FXO37_18495 [Capsicum annuum]KAF3678447.1 hypothetical protein FXO38_03235 [Capsicum annuum]